MAQAKTSGEDLRIRRTHKLLTEALYSLLEERPLDDVTVIDICERAMIHRTTFYKHFEDKYQLLAFCIRKLTEDFDAPRSAVFDGKNSRPYYLDIIRRLLRFFAAHKRMILLLIDRSRSNIASTMFHEIVVKNSEKRLEDEKKKGMSFRVPISVVTEYHIGAVISLAIWWLRNSMPYSEDRLMQYIDMLMNTEDVMSSGEIGSS